MNFKVTKAKFHPLEGLYLADASGEWFPTLSKWAMLEAGVVHFLYHGECPYRVACPEHVLGEAREIDGTDDPVTLSLARRSFHSEFNTGNGLDWVTVEISGKNTQEMPLTV